VDLWRKPLREPMQGEPSSVRGQVGGHVSERTANWLVPGTLATHRKS
jgi:hypothetical protein